MNTLDLLLPRDNLIITYPRVDNFMAHLILPVCRQRVLRWPEKSSKYGAQVRTVGSWATAEGYGLDSNRCCNMQQQDLQCISVCGKETWKKIHSSIRINPPQ